MTSTMRISSVCAAALAAAALMSMPSAARAASLDPAFGNNGRVTVSFGPVFGLAGDIAAMPDGRLVVAGLANMSFAVARLTPTGALDGSFGPDGRVVIPGFGNLSTTRAAPALALEPDGGVVVAGSTGASGSTDFALARLRPDGSLDPSFGNGGLVTVDPRGATLGVSLVELRDVAIAPDGRIVAVGVFGDDMAAIRLMPNGSLDPTFGSGGVFLSADMTGDVGNAVLLQPDGRIVVAGGALFPVTAFDLVAWRLLLEGTLDQSFGTGGRTTVPLGEGSALDGMAAHGALLLPNGAIVLVGSALLGGGKGDVGVARLTPDGLLDPGFGGDGVVVDSLSSWLDRGVGAVERAGTLYVGADYQVPVGEGLDRDAAVLALQPSGARDTAFGGVLGFPMVAASSDDAAAITLLPDGRIALLATVQGTGDQRVFGIAVVDPIGTDAVGPPPAQPKPEVPPAGVDRAKPHSRINRIPRVLRRLRQFSGQATDDFALARVDVALVRIVGRRGRAVRCELLRARDARFRRSPARKGRCPGRIWLRASGTAQWRFKLTRPLPRGAYVLFSRARDAAGMTESAFGAARHNEAAFRVR
jgi:uncharacterized delta-60 repeat protein